MGEKNINLMPEDLRSKETDASKKEKKDFSADLFIPDLQKKDKEKNRKFHKSGDSFWHKLLKMFSAKKPKEDKKAENKEEAILVREMKKNGHKPAEDKQAGGSEQSKGEDKKLENLGKHEEHREDAPDFKSLMSDIKPKDEIKEIVEEPEVPKPSREEKVEKEQKKEKEQDFSMPSFTLSKGRPEQNLEDASRFHQPSQRIRAKFIDEEGGVDLVPIATKIKGWKQIIYLLSISIVSALVILIIFYVILFIQGVRVGNQQEEKIETVSALEEQLLEFQAVNKEINKEGKDIELIYNILNKHVYWSNFFEMLEKYTVEEVYYDGLKAGDGGAIVLDAIGTNFDTVARQLKAFQQPAAAEFVTSAEVSNADLSSQGVEFSITIVLNPDLFYYKQSE